MEIAVIGGSGFTGSNVVAEASRRGHHVASIARAEQGELPPGAVAAVADLHETVRLLDVLAGTDVVIVAAAPRGDTAGHKRPAVAALVRGLPASTRIGVSGGAGGSRVSPGGPTLLQRGVPGALRAEAEEMIGVLEDLQHTDASRDWLSVHPPIEYGVQNPGSRRDRYRIGGHVLVTDESGRSAISESDFATAVLDEVERPRHRRDHFTVGY